MSLESQLEAGYVAIIFLWCSMSLYAYATLRSSLRENLYSHRHNRYKYRLSIIQFVATVLLAPVALWLDWLMYELGEYRDE